MTGLRFHRGWRKRWRDWVFALSCLRYLRKDRYPFFSPRAAWRLRTIGPALGLGKLPEFNGAYFTSPTLPHRPSRAFDHMVACGGLNFEAAGTDLKRHVGVVLMAITRRCELRCAHCYERANLASGETVPVERWKEVLRDVQRLGAGVVVFTGGEPMLRYEGLLDLLRSGDTDLSDFHLHTSGLGVTAARACELRETGLVAAAVGLDDVEASRHDGLRGREGSHAAAIAALRAFRDAGVFTYTNVCLSSELIRSGGLWEYYELTRQLGVGFIEMLEPKPCGGFAARAGQVMLSGEDRDAATRFFLEGNTAPRYADYPLISYVAYKEAPERFGCTMGGLTQVYIDSRGNVNPCVFLPITFGNVMRDDYETIFRRMRDAVPGPIRARCPAETLAPALAAAACESGDWPVDHASIRKEFDAAIRG